MASQEIHVGDPRRDVLGDLRALQQSKLQNAVGRPGILGIPQLALSRNRGCPKWQLRDTVDMNGIWLIWLIRLIRWGWYKISLRMMFFGHPMVMPLKYVKNEIIDETIGFLWSPLWALGRCNLHIARKKPKVTIWSNMFGCSPDSGMLVCFIMNQVLLAATIHIWTFWVENRGLYISGCKSCAYLVLLGSKGCRNKYPPKDDRAMGQYGTVWNAKKSRSSHSQGEYIEYIPSKASAEAHSELHLSHHPYSQYGSILSQKMNQMCFQSS